MSYVCSPASDAVGKLVVQFTYFLFDCRLWICGLCSKNAKLAVAADAAEGTRKKSRLLLPGRGSRHQLGLAGSHFGSTSMFPIECVVGWSESRICRGFFLFVGIGLS